MEQVFTMKSKQYQADWRKDQILKYHWIGGEPDTFIPTDMPWPGLREASDLEVSLGKDAKWRLQGMLFKFWHEGRQRVSWHSERTEKIPHFSSSFLCFSVISHMIQPSTAHRHLKTLRERNPALWLEGVAQENSTNPITFFLSSGAYNDGSDSFFEVWMLIALTPHHTPFPFCPTSGQNW